VRAREAEEVSMLHSSGDMAVMVSFHTSAIGSSRAHIHLQPQARPPKMRHEYSLRVFDSLSRCDHSGHDEASHQSKERHWTKKHNHHEGIGDVW
jgi:hypothetical protein